MSDATVKLINQEFVPLAINGGKFGEILTARGEVVAAALISGDTGGPDGKNNPLAPKRLQQAREKFQELLDMLAAQKIPMLGYHMPWPGIGHVAKQGDGFRYVPSPMQLVL